MKVPVGLNLEIEFFIAEKVWESMGKGCYRIKSSSFHDELPILVSVKCELFLLQFAFHFFLI